MLDKWQNEWTDGVTGRDIYNLIPRVKIRMVSWRREDIIFFTGHGPFPNYLYRFNLTTTEYCCYGGIGIKLHYATECPLTESWHLKKPASHLLHIWLRQAAGDERPRNIIFNIIRFILTNSHLLSPDP
ncbi:hypothetical protein AVEN_109370-1 [Araneus ventricosus]|uniref:Uncharacterized protein n=1 Tax=Araneus ventricosus TaxID=182803 RepID=A0A4Y2J6Z0_ARAVE|nr:hypothetical protein AVEN_109370-1 [Araneus ventricosus]